MLEASWEIFENTDFVINRYREATISLDYYGDSVLNSVCDILAMVGGFVAASRLRVWVVVLLTIALELYVGWAIRDNLTLNIIMLLHPFEGIKQWQGGGNTRPAADGGARPGTAEQGGQRTSGQRQAG